MVKKMNETIGTKGGRRDRKRTIIITSENKKKLKEYYQKKKKLRLEKLEKEVRNLQLASFLVAVPLSIAGNTFDAIFHVRDEKKEEREQAKSLQIEELHQAEKLELSETSIYIEDYQTNDRKFTDYGYPKTIEGKKVVPTAPRVRKETKEALEITEIPKEVTAKVSLGENDKVGIENPDPSTNTSNGYSVSSLGVKGNRFGFIVNSTVSAKLNITFMLSVGAPANQIIDNLLYIAWNEQRYNTDHVLVWRELWHQWEAVTIKGLELKEGDNILDMLVIADGCPNIDCFKFEVNPVDEPEPEPEYGVFATVETDAENTYLCSAKRIKL